MSQRVNDERAADLVSRAYDFYLTSREEITSGINDLVDDRTEQQQQIATVTQERDDARRRLLSAAGDDLCRLSQDEIKAMSAGDVKIPPKEEFLASCERFHSQVAGEAGVLEGCMTLAQLIAENERQRQRLADVAAKVASLETELNIWRPMTNEEVEQALAEAEAVPISQEKIDRILAKITDPTYRPTEPEHVALAAKVRQQQRFIDEVQAACANEGPQTIEHLLACVKLGELTTIIGKARHEQLRKAETELTAAREQLATFERWQPVIAKVTTYFTGHDFTAICDIFVILPLSS